MMLRPLIVVVLLQAAVPRSPGQLKPAYPAFDYEAAREHEIKPHRREIPHEGIASRWNSQIHIKLIVSPGGDVLEANAEAEDQVLDLWPEIEPEVKEWKFTPFEKNGKAVTAEVDEYIDLVPPERLPKTRVPAPVLRPSSAVVITLRRSGCFGSCPAYQVSVNSDGVVWFEGRGYVVANGRHTDRIDPQDVRRLAKRFIDANFFSMDQAYTASVTDCPTYSLSITVDGHSRQVEDYMGTWVGMPAVIRDLEEEVDALARSDRWIKGTDGLVDALRGEKYNFKTFDAQVILKEAAQQGQTPVVQGLLDAGVPLKPISAPKPAEPYRGAPLERVGWLTAAAAHAETLKALIAAGASEKDQADKDVALVGAAGSGSLEAVRALIAYGANPNADLKGGTVNEGGGAMAAQYVGTGNVLYFAAQSGNPALLRELLAYGPDVNAPNRYGETALFALGESRSGDKEGALVECLRLLVQAGANVNARDHNGNTPLHKIYRTDVEEELLKLGADVNARNNDGETPIFTNVDNDSVGLFIAHGADLTMRNNKGETAMDVAQKRGPTRVEALEKAMQSASQQ